MSTDTAMPEKLGRYEIKRELGKGAMGVVYEASDPNIGGRRVAIKTARRDLLEGSGHADELLERFLREAQAAGNLNHPSIIRIYDADQQGGTAYIAMEFIEGEDLGERWEKKGRPGIEEAIELCATICDALDHAHKAGVVHRDIKPANIMMLDDGTLRIADFGIARLEDSELTATGQMIGTPHYMSPEQFQGQKVDGRADLFSVAVMLYEMATGEKPFPGDNLSTVMQKVTMQAPIQAKHLNVQVPGALDAVLMKALSKAPMERYQNGKDMAAALRECMRENPDENILKVKLGGATDVAATVVGDAATDATLVPGAATVSVKPETPPAQAAQETIAQAPPGADISTAATIAGAPPAGVAPEASKPPMMMIGGGVGAIAVIGAIVYFAMGMGGGAEPGASGGADTAGVATATSPETTEPAAPAAEFDFSVPIFLYKNTDGVSTLDFEFANRDKFDEAIGAEIRFVDPDNPSTEVAESITLDYAGQPAIFKASIERVQCEISLDGYEPDNATVTSNPEADIIDRRIFKLLFEK